MTGSIYGPGVLNDTIVPGYEITKFPVDLNTFWQLPNRTIRNFGEASQYVTYPAGRPQYMYNLAQNFTSPNHISQWDPMLLSIGGIPNQETTNPWLTQKGLADAYKWGANMVKQYQIQQAIQGIAGALNSMESSLANVVKSDKLTKAQKAELKGLLEEVKALKEKIAKQLKDKNPEMEEVTAMQKKVQDLQKKVSDAASKINGQIAGSQGSEGSEGSNSSTGSSASSDTDDADNDTTAKKQHEENVKGMKDVCMYLDKAMSGCGTNYDDNEYGMYKILSNPALVNEDNIVELFEQWENSYAKVGDYADDSDGFIESLMDECEGGQKEDVASIIVTLLEKRADKLGIDVSSEAAAARNAMKSNWIGWRDDDDIQRTVNALYNKVKQANEKHIETTDKKSEAKKAEAEKKAKERKNEVTKEKLNEIANKLKEALKLKEVPQLSTALKIETDDDGEFTGYSIDLNTQNGKVTVKGQTYQELALAIEKNNLEVEDVLIRKTQA